MKNKTLFQNGYFVIKKCRHGYFAYNSNDTFIGRSLDLYGEWSEHEIRNLLTLLSPGDVVIDVGAYIGTQSIPFAKAVLPKGRVYAIESQRTAFTFLNANIALNNLANVISINKYASNRIDKVTIPQLDPKRKQNFGALNLDEHKGGDYVETITIDSLKLPKVNLIKIDTEGAELKVIKGAEKTIKRCKPYLCVENTNSKKSPKIVSKIFDLGYNAYWDVFTYYNVKNYYKNSINVFYKYHPEVNLICVPKTKNQSKIKLEPVISTKDTWQEAIDRWYNSPAQK